MKTRKSEIILQKAQRWNLSGVSFLHTGKHRKGLRRLKRAVKLLETLNFKEKGKVQDEYLSICIVLGDYFREKFDKNPYVRAMSSIGPVILTDGNMINAIKYYEKACSIRPKDITTNLKLIDVLFAARRYEESIPVLKASLSVAKSDLPLTAVLHLKLAIAKLPQSPVDTGSVKEHLDFARRNLDHENKTQMSQLGISYTKLCVFSMKNPKLFNECYKHAMEALDDGVQNQEVDEVVSHLVSLSTRIKGFNQ
jgi:tetratricopeptide (TPR) repeat protein